MGAGHAHALLHHAGTSRIHRAPAHLKVLALIGFMLVVVATPGTWYPVFGLYLGVLGLVIAIAKVPVLHIVRRMVVEIPFVVFAILMPFIAHGPRIEVWGLSLSESGLISAWTLLAKATLGVIGGLTLAATTEPTELLAGLERLRVPSTLVQIMAFMLRYLEVVTDEFRRQRIALESRGFTARSPRHWPVLGRSLGALFIRSFERGERVHLAMLSRGYTGRMPQS